MSYEKKPSTLES